MPQGAPIPILHVTPEAVDFVTNRANTYHPAFDTSSCRYSPTQQQFIPLVPLVNRSGVPHVAESSAFEHAPSQRMPQPRSKPTSISDMSFWADAFPAAMTRLSREVQSSSLRDQKNWEIRSLTSWTGVQARLQEAQQQYEFPNEQTHVGKFRRKLRSTLDKGVTPLQQGAKVVPDNDIASPVAGVIQVLLDAYQQASEAREEITSVFDNLPEAFEEVDFQLGLFPKDRNIFQKSVDLILTILRAVEQAIRFYTSTQAARAGRAILQGDKYQEKLRLSVQINSDATRDSHHVLIEGNWATHRAVEAVMLEYQAQTAWVCNMANQVLSLLNDQGKNWPPRSHIPSRPTSPMILPVTNTRPWTPHEIWHHLHISNLDELDIPFTLRRVGDFIHEDRGRAQQVIATPHFRTWITSCVSAKLLVHGDFQDSAAAGRPLSPFSVLTIQLIRLSRGHGNSFMLRATQVIAQMQDLTNNQPMSHRKSTTHPMYSIHLIVFYPRGVKVFFRNLLLSRGFAVPDNCLIVTLSSAMDDPSKNANAAEIQDCETEDEVLTLWKLKRAAAAAMDHPKETDDDLFVLLDYGNILKDDLVSSYANASSVIEKNVQVVKAKEEVEETAKADAVKENDDGAEYIENSDDEDGPMTACAKTAEQSRKREHFRSDLDFLMYVFGIVRSGTKKPTDS
ncbi:hypothetical protein GGR57DRAFT_504220 [Xylariaceae sp. FL1272]|nr:hypothetical protein GGR57DRAFT_504220 [Xylariaceae sp. FL1272]